MIHKGIFKKKGGGNEGFFCKEVCMMHASFVFF